MHNILDLLLARNRATESLYANLFSASTYRIKGNAEMKLVTKNPIGSLRIWNGVPSPNTINALFQKSFAKYKLCLRISIEVHVLRV